LGLRVELKEHRFQRRDQWNVEAVHPDDAVFGVVAVIVPGPTGRQDQIPRLHVDALAVDGGVGATAFDDEANCRRSVAVRARHFAGKQYLDGGDQIIRRRPAAAQTGIK